MAAPPMNPTIAACDRKSTRNPNLYISYPQIFKENKLQNKHEHKLKKLSYKTMVTKNADRHGMKSGTRNITYVRMHKGSSSHTMIRKA